MKKIILGIMQITCIILLLSCQLRKVTMTNEKVKCDDCDNYTAYIKNNWKLDSTGLYFFAALPNCREIIHGKNGISYTMIVGRNCLIGSHADAVKRLFGAPTKEYPNRFDYYMTDKCHGKARGDKPNIPGCIRLQVYFTEDRKVVGIGGMTRE